MRAASVLALMVLGAWLVLTIRLNCTEINFGICERLCDRRGRTLSSISPGFVTKCYCGGRKLERSNERP